MTAMQTRRALINTGLILAGVMLSAILLNLAVLKTGALGGISLTEALADEFRIRFMPIPNNSNRCITNLTHLSPGCEGDFYGNNVRLPKTHIRINSLGFRGREYPTTKGNRTVRIFIVGDSFTFGEGVNDEDTYANVVEQRLNTRPEGTDYGYEVFNLGILGVGTDIEYQRLLNYLQYSPDLLVLQTHHDDIFDCGPLHEFQQEFEAEFIERARRPDISSEWIRQSQKYLSELSKEERCSCVRLYFGLIANTTREMGVPLIVLNLGWDGECFEEGKSDYTVVKSRSLESLGRRYQVSRMDQHLNAAGHELVAQMLLPALVRTMNSTRAGVLT